MRTSLTGFRLFLSISALACAVMLPRGIAAEADAVLSAMLSRERIAEIVGLIPDDWLTGEPHFAGAAQHRAAYLEYLCNRLAERQVFVEEAQHARAQLI